MLLLTKEDMDFRCNRKHPLNITAGINILNTGERQLEIRAEG